MSKFASLSLIVFVQKYFCYNKQPSLFNTGLNFLKNSILLIFAHDVLSHSEKILEWFVKSVTNAYLDHYSWWKQVILLTVTLVKWFVTQDPDLEIGHQIFIGTCSDFQYLQLAKTRNIGESKNFYIFIPGACTIKLFMAVIVAVS